MAITFASSLHFRLQAQGEYLLARRWRMRTIIGEHVLQSHNADV